MANLKWLRAEAHGRFHARSRRWRWRGRAPPVRTRGGKNNDKLLATQVLPAYRPCRVPLRGLQRIRLILVKRGTDFFRRAQAAIALNDVPPRVSRDGRT